MKFSKIIPVAVAVLVAAVVMVSAVPTAFQVSNGDIASPQSDGTTFVDDTHTYKCQISDGSVTITSEAKGGYSVTYRDDRTLTIPNEVVSQGYTYKVTSIGDNALEACCYTDIVVPSGVSLIGNEAFAHNLILNSVEFEGDDIEFGDSVFCGCEALKKVTLPTGLESIPVDTFAGCINLTEVVVPAAVVKVGNEAFAGCSGLETVDMSNSNVKSIGSGAFSGCTGLKTISFPATLQTVADNAFDGAQFRAADGTTIHTPTGLAGLTFAQTEDGQYQVAVPAAEPTDERASYLVIGLGVLLLIGLIGVLVVVSRRMKRKVYE